MHVWHLLVLVLQRGMARLARRKEVLVLWVLIPNFLFDAIFRWVADDDVIGTREAEWVDFEVILTVLDRIVYHIRWPVGVLVAVLRAREPLASLFLGALSALDQPWHPTGRDIFGLQSRSLIQVSVLGIISCR